MEKNLFAFSVMIIFCFTEAFSQAHFTISYENCTSTADEIQFDMMIINDGNLSLDLHAIPFRLTHNAGIVPAGQHTLSLTYIDSTTDFPAVFLDSTRYNVLYQPATSLLLFTTSILNFTSSTAPSVPMGGPAMRVGRFSFKINSGTWVPGEPADINYYSSGNGALFYVNGSANPTIYDQADTTVVQLIPPCNIYTDIENVSYDKIAGLFPNPADEFINVSFSSVSKIQSAEIYEVTGRMVKEIIELDLSDDGNVRIEVEGLKSGALFFIRIITESNVLSFPFMKI